MKKMRIKLIIVCLVAFFSVLTVSGCAGTGKTIGNSNGEITPPTTKGEQPDLRLALYYAKFTQDDSYLVREVHQIPYTDNAVLGAVKQLIEVHPTTPGALRVLPSNTQVLGVEIKNGSATVDFSREVLQANVGSAGESLGILSIVNTLTEFPDVENVSFTVEGKIDERTTDWWGHVGLYDQPFQRNVSMVREPAIWLSHPEPDQILGAPMRVRGSALVDGGKLMVRLLDHTGNVLAETTETIEPTSRKDFEVCLKYESPSSDRGELVVSGLETGGSGSEFTVRVPVLWP